MAQSLLLMEQNPDELIKKFSHERFVSKSKRTIVHDYKKKYSDNAYKITFPFCKHRFYNRRQRNCIEMLKEQGAELTEVLSHDLIQFLMMTCQQNQTKVQ